MINKHLEKCSVLLRIRERQIKTTITSQFTHNRIAIVKKGKQTIRNVGNGVEKLELIHFFLGM